MEKITDFINRTNPNKNVQKTDINTQNTKQEQTNDSFEKKDDNLKNNKKRNVVITAIVAGVALVVGFIKRKDISGFFSNLFNKNSIHPLNDATKPELTTKVTGNIPVDKVISKTTFKIEGLNEKALNTMQSALDDLTIRVNDKSLNSGVGFIGENIEKREEAMNAFLDQLTENNYEVAKVRKINEDNPEKTAIELFHSIKNSEEKFQQTGKRTVFVIRDLDVIAEDTERGIKYHDIAATIQDQVEHCKEKGFAWVWDAKSGKNIDSPLLKRTPYRIII